MRIVLIGASGHAKVVIDILEKAGDHTIVGLITEDALPERRFSGYPVLGGFHDLLAVYQNIGVEGLVAAVGDNWSRSDVVRRANELLPTVAFLQAIHPAAQIAGSVVVGPGTVVMPGAVVNSGTVIGPHCIINTGSSIDHDTVLSAFVSIGPGATLGGNVHVGAGSAISLGANVIHGITIGEHTVIGAGSTVVRDVPGHVVAYGTPARVIRERASGQRYL